MAHPIDPIIERVKCNFCGGKRTNKGGFVDKDKKRQRYYCRDCQRFFRENAVYRKRKESYAPKLDLLPSEERLIDELRQIAQTLGKTPRFADITRLSKQKQSHTTQNYYAVFGNYVEAVKAAGLKQHYRQEFDKEKLLAELHELGKTLNEPMFARHIVEARRKSLVSPKNHFDNAFGSISKAIEAAGVNKKYSFDDFSYLPRKQGEYLPRAKQYSRDDLIRHLKKLETKIGRIPRQKDIEENYKKDVRPSLKAYLNEFGTISKARKAAHILNIQWQKFSKTELIEQLKKLGEKLGRRPTDRDIVRACNAGEAASAQVFANNFGGLIKAYEAAGFEVLKPKEYSDREIIKRLRKLRQKLGKRIGWNDLKRASIEGWCPSPNTVYLRIGNVDRIEEILNA
jgi:Homing endonuclease associated repeat